MLAHDLGVSRGLVVAVYEQLTAEGYLVSRRGSGTMVSPEVVTIERHGRTANVTAKRLFPFTPSYPDLNLFPRQAWARSFRSALRKLPDDALGSGDPLGLPVLREALADYLRRVRGVACERDHVVICGGFGHGFVLVTRMLATLGYPSIALEDPGDIDLVSVIEEEGLASVPVAVDDEGLCVDRLEASEARAVVVTPANQHPIGVVLSPARRHRLCDWARRCDGFVLEDDCEAEFRHDRQPTACLQGVAADRVIYLGTTWQSLAPGLRIGWVVVPPALTDVVAATSLPPAGFTSVVLQATFAEFLMRGDLDRHLRAVRKVYRQRRDALVAAIDRWLPEAQVTGIAAGLHVVAMLPDGTDAERLATTALSAGVEVRTLSSYRADRRTSPPGLVLGYARLTPSQIQNGIERLAAAAHQLGRTRISS
jgi:GntR family transcriptional regulator/MocR family aminotransferase